MRDGFRPLSSCRISPFLAFTWLLPAISPLGMANARGMNHNGPLAAEGG
jgi:hypothetical protein